ncbi:hypothetical protein RJT34_14182 [Clitoria ternatea]|uniref:Beta-glucosidase n=1 Tax=Clitoria ternatea TaxID=43366 RepID=A0AAN9JTE9_CLITE
MEQLPLLLHHRPLLALTLSFCFSIFLGSCHDFLSFTENSTSSPFPASFLFGTASSSYQFEGAYLADGKGLNNWDVFTHQQGTIVDGSTGDIAVDHYHRYQKDVDLMDYIGVNSYRFSLSWARIVPKGRFGKVNRAGIHHYDRLIHALLSRGIEPFVTITHYDIPQELEDRYKSWLSPEIQKEFRYYADICFKNFGDRVKYWVTFNEPNVAIIRGYRTGIWPPSRCSASFGRCNYAGDSETEPFIAAHNLLLSHAAAVHLYKTKYQEKQGGKIGLVMNTEWFEPFSNSSEDKSAVERARSFYMNWFLDPVILGKYPKEMVEILGPKLPAFSRTDLEKLKSGLDFIGINQYTSAYVRDCIFSACEVGRGSSKTEGSALISSHMNDVNIGKPTALDWLYVHPQGMEKIVTYIKDRYNNIPMYITENGLGTRENSNSTTEDIMNDVNRVEYLSAYLDSLATTIRNGANVRGYFVWSLLDNFEWTDGYTVRFGLHHVHYPTLNRTQRLSAFWYKNYIANHKHTQDRSTTK